MFFLRSCFFLYWKTEARQKSGFYSDFSCTIILRTIVVEYVKESQGGFESTLDYFQQVNGLVYHLL
jgi:hypothetical protein